MKKTRTVMTVKNMDAQEKDIVRNLEAHRDAIDRYEAALLPLRRDRDVLIKKLRKRGWTGRDIEPHAGVSNVYIYRMKD